jgi:sarcosine oxidase subunit beta
LISQGEVEVSNTYDAIVIGAGIMGCCSAYELARRGVKVALLEKGTVGAGPSGKSSAVVRQHYSNELTARMALYSLGVFREFEERVGGECGFTNIGFAVAVEAGDYPGLEANVAMQRRLGVNTNIISVEALSEIMPGMETADLVAAAYEPDSGYADPYLTVTSYAQAARRYGATVFQETEVTGILSREGRVVGVDTATGSLEAPIVLNCAGSWAAPVAAMTGVWVPINACRVQVAFFRRPEGHEQPHPVVVDFINATYFRPETGRMTLAGLVDPSEANAIVDPDNYQEYTDNEFVLDVGERLVRRYPAMERSESTGGYASLYAITPDWHPVIDEVPKGSGFFICSGFSGHGFKLGPAVGVIVADLVTGNSSPSFDPQLLRYDRFAEEDLVRGQYEYSIAG